MTEEMVAVEDTPLHGGPMQPAVRATSFLVLATGALTTLLLTTSPSNAEPPVSHCGSLSSTDLAWEGPHQLSCNATIPSGATLRLLPGASLDLNGYALSSGGGNIAVEAGATDAENATISTSRPYGYISLSSGQLEASGTYARLSDVAVYPSAGGRVQLTGATLDNVTVLGSEGSALAALGANVSGGRLEFYSTSINGGSFHDVDLLLRNSPGAQGGPVVRDASFSGDGSLKTVGDVDLAQFSGNDFSGATAAGSTMEVSGSGTLKLGSTTGLDGLGRVSLPASGVSVAVHGRVDLGDATIAGPPGSPYQPRVTNGTAAAELVGGTLDGLTIAGTNAGPDATLVVSGSRVNRSWIIGAASVSTEVKRSTIANTRVIATQSERVQLIDNSVRDSAVEAQAIGWGSAPYKPVIRGNAFAGDGSLLIRAGSSWYGKGIIDLSEVRGNTVDENATAAQRTVKFDGDSEIQMTASTDLGEFDKAVVSPYGMALSVSGHPSLPGTIEAAATGGTPRQVPMYSSSAATISGVELRGIDLTARAPLTVADVSLRDGSLTGGSHPIEVSYSDLTDSRIVGGASSANPVKVTHSVLTRANIVSSKAGLELEWNTLDDSDLDVQAIGYVSSPIIPVVRYNYFSGDGSILIRATSSWDGKGVINLSEFRGNMMGYATPAQRAVRFDGDSEIQLTSLADLNVFDKIIASPYGTISVSGMPSLPDLIEAGPTGGAPRQAVVFATAPATLSDVELRSIDLSSRAPLSLKDVSAFDSNLQVVKDLSVVDSYVRGGLLHSPGSGLLTVGNSKIDRSNFIASGGKLDVSASSLLATPVALSGVDARFGPGTRIYAEQDATAVQVRGASEVEFEGTEDDAVVISSICDLSLGWEDRAAYCTADPLEHRPDFGVVADDTASTVKTKDTAIAYVEQGLSIAGHGDVEHFAIAGVLDRTSSSVDDTDFIGTDVAADHSSSWVSVFPACVYDSYLPLTGAFFGPDKFAYSVDVSGYGVDFLTGVAARGTLKALAPEQAAAARGALEDLTAKESRVSTAVAEHAGAPTDAEGALKASYGKIVDNSRPGELLNDVVKYLESPLPESPGHNRIPLNAQPCTVPHPSGAITVPVMTAPLTTPAVVLTRNHEPNTQYGRDLIALVQPAWSPDSAVERFLATPVPSLGVVQLYETVVAEFEETSTNDYATPYLPGSPYGLSGSSGSSGSVRWAWSDYPAPRDDLMVGYRVEYREVGTDEWRQPFARPQIIDGTSITLGGLTSGKSYEVSVRVVSVNGFGPAATSVVAAS